MALEQPSYNLKNVGVTLLGGVKGIITSVNIERKPLYANRTAGSSWPQQQTAIGEDFPTIDCEGWNSDEIHFKDVPPNTPIDSFDLTSNDDADESILQSDFFTKFPVDSMAIGPSSTTLNGTDNSMVRFSIVSNVLNVGNTP